MRAYYTLLSTYSVIPAYDFASALALANRSACGAKVGIHVRF